MSSPFSDERVYKQWPRKYSESRKPKDDRPFVDSLNEHNPYNQGVRLFSQQYEGDKTFFPVEVVSQYCRNVSRQHMFTSNKGTAWLDDRSKPTVSELAGDAPSCGSNSVVSNLDSANASDCANASLRGQEAPVLPIMNTRVGSRTNESVGTSFHRTSTIPSPRIYEEWLTPARLFFCLLPERFNHGELADADRRLVYIVDPDPSYILALTDTEREYQKDALLELLWQFIDRQTSIEVSIPLRGFSVFRLEIHLPCFALRVTPPEDLNRRKRRSTQADWIDVSFLAEDAEEGIMGIHLAHFSLTVCGTDNSCWTAYALETKSFDPDRGDDFRLPERRSDEISMGQLDADKTIWDPREYFLNIFQIRADHMLKETRELVRVMEASYNRRALCHRFSHAARNNKPSTLDWNEDMLLLLQHLIPNISKATESWTRFADPGKDIGYFRDRHQPSSVNTRARLRELLELLDQTFDKIQRLQATLESIELRCEKLAERLEFDLTRQGSQIGGFTLSVVSPIVIVATIFAIPDPVLSYERSSLTFFLTTALGMLLLHVLLLINGGWQHRQRWWDKLSRRAQAAWHGDETLTALDEAGNRVIRRRSMHVDSVRDA